MRILVTGGAGFIGSHVAEAYARAGHEVLVVDDLSTGKQENLPEKIRLEIADLLRPPQIKRIFRDFRPEIVNHHAAQVNVRLSWEHPQEDARINVLGSLTLLQQMVKWRTKRIIYSSSGGAVYGEATQLPVSEDCAVRPLSNYGVSKFAVELYLRSFAASAEFNSVVLRYPNVYGPRQDPSGEAGVVAIFATQLLRSERPRIFGDGTKTRDYVYVEDIVAANLRALDPDCAGTFNLGWGRQVSDREVFTTVRAAVGSSIEPILDEKRPGEIDHICLDATRARTTLSWRPVVSFEEGVRRTVQYWKERIGPTHKVK